MIRARLILAAVLLLFLFPACEDEDGVVRHYLPESDIRVPGDYGTIQEALDAAKSGDVIEVAPGTYYEALAFPAFSVTLRSRSDNPLDTILDGSQNGDGVILVDFPENAPGARTLRGFTLTRSNGRAVSVDFQADDGEHVFERCRFVDNGPWGALRCSGKYLKVSLCEFIDNDGYGFGAGILLTGNATIEGCTFRNNDAIPFETITLTQGGAIHAQSQGGREGSVLQVSNCVFEGNHCTDYGGAIQVTSFFEAMIANNTFMGNSADACAGGIYVIGSDGFITTIENNLFVGETSPLGAAIGMHFAKGTIVRNNTIVGSIGGEGIRAQDSEGFTIENNIVAFGESYGISSYFEGPPAIGVISCNNSYGNPAGNYNNSLDPVGDNIVSDPMFCDAEVGNFKLLPASPCRPTGNDCGVFMGAYENDCGEIGQ